MINTSYKDLETIFIRTLNNYKTVSRLFLSTLFSNKKITKTITKCRIKFIMFTN